MPLGDEDPVRVAGGIKVVGTEHRRRDVVRLLGCMAVAVACGCDPSGITITSVTAKWPSLLKLQLRVGFKTPGASRPKSVELRGTIAGVELARVFGKVQGSSVTFEVEISLTTKGINKIFQNTINKQRMQGSITIEAVFDTLFGAVTVNDEWSGEISLK